MLNQANFKTGMKELILAFNLELGTDQIKIWYKYCKKLSDAEFRNKVKDCIATCRHKPYIADLLNPQQDYTYAPANAGAYEVI